MSDEDREYTEEEIKAATKLEAIARGNHDRERVRLMKEGGNTTEDGHVSGEEETIEAVSDKEEEEHNEETDTGMTEEEAALKIEAVARGRKDREKVAQMRKKRDQEKEDERRRKEEEILEQEQEEEQRRQQEAEEEAEQKRQQEEEEEAEQQRQQEDDEAQAAVEQQQAKKRTKKRKKGHSFESKNKVHPDDVEICEAREIGSSKMLRNLHIGNRKLPGSPVVYILGTYTDMDEDMKEKIKNIFSHGIAVAASVSDAVIIDGGLVSHLSSAETTAEVRPLSSVLGISRCEGMYGIDPNLSHFHQHHIVVRCNPKALWKARIKLIRSIIGGGKRPRPVLVILAGNEEGCEGFLRTAADMNWGIIVVPETGGQADELCSAVAGDGTTSKTMQFVADNGNISIIPESCGANEMRTMCRMHLMLSGLSEYWDEVEDDDGSD